MAFSPQALLRPLLELEEEEGVLLSTSEGLANSGRYGSGPYYLDPLPDELFLGRLDDTSLRVPSFFLWKYPGSLYNLRQYRLGFNDKPLPMGQGCINEIIIILIIDGGHNNDLTS